MAHSRSRAKDKVCTDASLIAFYWKGRGDALDICADRLHAFMRDFARQSPLLKSWKSLTVPLSLDSIQGDQRVNWRKREVVRRFLGQGVFKSYGKEEPQSGYHVGLYSDAGADVSGPISVEVSSGHHSPNISDRLLIECSPSSPVYVELARLPLLLAICETIVKCWAPDNGVVISRDLHDECFPNSMYEVGWITYRSSRLPFPSLPKRFKTREVPGRGTLILATAEPFSSKRSTHVKALQELGSLLPSLAPKRLPASDWTQNLPETNIEGVGCVMYLPWKPSPRTAPKFAQRMVTASRRISSVKLDYSPASLREVDKLIGQFRRHVADPNDIAETLFSFGCYVGEVFVRNVAGKWKAEHNSAGGLIVSLGQDSWCDPIARTFKRMENGAKDSIAYFYHVMTTSLEAKGHR
jgi:hypothetical protein